MKLRICIVTGTRAEYGLLRGVIRKVHQADDCILQLVVTAAHLSPEFGLTSRDIEADGFPIADRIEILLSSDSGVGVGKAMGLGLIGLVDVFARIQPDIIVLLGDRFEMLAAAAAALVLNIPIAHINGGEITEGAFDEAIRHSITKMAHLHFVAAAPYRDRVIQLGEDPARVFLVGGLGVDAIKELPLLSRADLESELDFPLGPTSLLVTFHPPTMNPKDAARQMQALLDSLAGLHPDTRLIFTMPNADVGSRELRSLIERFSAQRAHTKAFTSLGQLRYLSCMKYVDGVVGNSSSGIAEAPTFKVGTVDIGDRQRGRLKASSIISCAADKQSIDDALQQLLSQGFRSRLSDTINPYGNGSASGAIVETLRRFPREGLLKKRFYDRTLA